MLLRHGSGLAALGVVNVLSLTRKADYAIVALSDLARRGASRSSARAVSERTQVPLPVLTNILHKLSNHGLVTSVMGAKGGYALVRPPAEITLAQIIDAIEGTFRLTICCESDQSPEPSECNLQDNCQIVEPLRRVHERLRQFLGEVSLAEIAFYTTPIELTLESETLDMGSAPAEAVG